MVEAVKNVLDVVCELGNCKTITTKVTTLVPKPTSTTLVRLGQAAAPAAPAATTGNVRLGV